jgi:hypothetical protein
VFGMGTGVSLAPWAPMRLRLIGHPLSWVSHRSLCGINPQSLKRPVAAFPGQWKNKVYIDVHEIQIITELLKI